MPRCSYHLAAALLVSLSLWAAPMLHAAESAMQTAINKVERESDGKVLAVQTLERNKRKIYLIKVLTRDGRVKVVQVRAND